MLSTRHAHLARVSWSIAKTAAEMFIIFPAVFFALFLFLGSWPSPGKTMVDAAEKLLRGAPEHNVWDCEKISVTVPSHSSAGQNYPRGSPLDSDQHFNEPPIFDRVHNCQLMTKPKEQYIHELDISIASLYGASVLLAAGLMSVFYGYRKKEQ